MSDRSAPVVDVGVVSWNTAELTTRALRRLLDSDQGVDLNVLVRDNGSTDDTVERLASEVPEASVDAGEVNLGFAAGMNSLIDRSSAEWFLALNSDAWPATAAIGRLVDTASRHPGAAAVAPRLERPNGDLEHSTHPFPSIVVAGLSAVAGPRWLPRPVADRLLLEPAWDHRRPRPVDWAVGAALLMRRTALEELGGFDESFFMYAEDLDWCHRAHAHGWSIRFESNASVVHVGNASGAQSYGNRRTRAYLENTNRWYLRTHGRARTRVYRMLNALAAHRESRHARRSGDSEAADWWRAIRRLHLAPVPDSDTSRPTTAGRR